jgi:type II secretory pathway component HofQ
MTISTLILAGFVAFGQLVTIDAKEMDLGDFFRLMARTANVNVVLHPAVAGKVNLMVTDAPWEQVMDSVLKNYGLAKEVEGNILRIAPAATLQGETTQSPATNDATVNPPPLQTHVYFLSYARAEDVAVAVSRLVSDRGSVIAYTPLNALIVTDVAP